MESLSQVRAEIVARRRRAKEVAAFYEAFKAATPTPGSRKSTYRCMLRHSRSSPGAPKVAEAFKTDLGILFVSKIDWVPSDQLTLTPWYRERTLGEGLDEVSFGLCMTNDEYLQNLLDDSDAWSAGRPADGPRWLQSAPPTVIIERVEIPRAPDALSLWARCKEHPSEAEAFEHIKIIADFR